MPNRRKTFIAVAAVTAALGAGGVAIAGASGDDEDRSPERPITGNALDRASAVALEHVGSGRVTGTETGDEEGRYEIEVTRGDGRQVDVHLDESFKVLGPKADDDERGDRDGRSDDRDGAGED